jgi:hypothetical protein
MVSEDWELRAGPSFYLQETVGLRYNELQHDGDSPYKAMEALTFA